MSDLPTNDIYTLVKLQEAWKKGRRFKFVYFWNFEKEDVLLDEFNETCLSQWFPSDFVDDNGRKYNSCEQYMMAQKAILFKDNETLEKILANSNPAEIKKLGREVKNFDQDKWQENCQEIVFKGNLYKFSQNEKLKRYILSVPLDNIFVEASPFDAIWGIHLSAHKASKKTPLQWEGTNYLGFQLTKVRDYLLNENVE